MFDREAEIFLEDFRFFPVFSDGDDMPIHLLKIFSNISTYLMPGIIIISRHKIYVYYLKSLEGSNRVMPRNQNIQNTKLIIVSIMAILRQIFFSLTSILDHRSETSGQFLMNFRLASFICQPFSIL